jgi:hypothetical protein
VIAKIIRTVVPARLKPSGYLENLVRNRTRGRVHSGPFAGMRWISSAPDCARIHIPKLLGIYERELNPYIDQACALNFSRIVDVGAAEGYYAVGMALRNPHARVIAFEIAFDADGDHEIQRCRRSYRNSGKVRTGRSRVRFGRRNATVRHL